MNLHLLLLLIWLLGTLAAWLWSRPVNEERSVIGTLQVSDRLRFALLGTRAIERHTADAEEQRIIAEHARRTRIGGLIVLLPLAIYGVLFAVGQPSDHRVVDATPASMNEPRAPIPEDQEPTVRTYLRGPSELSELNPDEEPEPLEEKRTPTRLYATAKVKPLYNNETLLGIQILRVDSGSFWEMIGFRSGDFILEANGELMDTPAASVSFMNAMNSNRELVIRVRGTDEEERILVFNASELE